VQDYLSQQVEDIDPFIWPFLRDNLAVCHCLFSRSAAAITPIFPPVDLVPTFDDCPRRIYMSATIADDSEIVRTFGASPEAVAKPITSTSLAGVGERMILVPELMKLGGAAITPMVKDIATTLAQRKRGVAILAPPVPSPRRGLMWPNIPKRRRPSPSASEQCRPARPSVRSSSPTDTTGSISPETSAGSW
jgi:hypothetical protein